MPRNDHFTEFGKLLAHNAAGAPDGIVAAIAVKGCHMSNTLFANAYASPRIGRQNAVTTNKLQSATAHSRVQPRSDVGKPLAHIECREIAVPVSNSTHKCAQVLDYPCVIVLQTGRSILTTIRRATVARFSNPGDNDQTPVPTTDSDGQTRIQHNSYTKEKCTVANTATVEQLSYRIKTLALATGLSPRFIVKEITDGNLRAQKKKGATIILAEEARRWIAQADAPQVEKVGQK